MADNVPDFDTMDDALWVKVDESRRRYKRDPTPENRDAYRRAFKAFADWVLRGKKPDGQPATGGPK
jgi:hypothetical protein